MSEVLLVDSLANHLQFIVQSNEIQEFLESGERMEYPRQCPAKFIKLINSCWANSPQDRPSFEWIVNYIEEIPKTDLQLGNVTITAF